MIAQIAEGLNDIIRQLDGIGATQVSLTHLRRMKDVLEFLDLAGIEDPGVAMAAAQAAILGPQAVPELTSLLGGDNPPSDWMAPAALADGVRSDEDLQATLAATLLALEGRYGKYREAILPICTPLAAEDGRAGTLGTAIRRFAEQRGTAPPLRPSAIDRAHPFFSISIDLSGSTAAKERTRRVAGDDRQRATALDEELLKAFFRIECEFLRHCTSTTDGAAGSPIPVADLFAVKSIGDEIWLTSRADFDDPAATAARASRLVDAALWTISRTAGLMATQNEEGPAFEPTFDHGRVDRIICGAKIVIDYVHTATDAAGLRDEIIREMVMDPYRAPFKDLSDADRTRALRNLSNGAWEPAGFHRSLRIERTDPIGTEVDRFFRISKHALPGTVLVGSTFAAVTGWTLHPTSGPALRLTNPVAPNSRFGRHDDLYALPQPLEPRDLSGLTQPYGVLHLFSPRQLKASYVQDEANQGMGIESQPYAKTQERLPLSLIDSLISAPEPPS